MYDDGQSAQVEFLRRQCEETINDASIDVGTRETHCKDILNYISDFASRSHMDMRYFTMDHHPPNTFDDLFTTSTQLDQLKTDLHITK